MLPVPRNQGKWSALTPLVFDHFGRNPLYSALTPLVFDHSENKGGQSLNADHKCIHTQLVKKFPYWLKKILHIQWRMEGFPNHRLFRVGKRFKKLL